MISKKKKKKKVLLARATVLGHPTVQGMLRDDAEKVDYLPKEVDCHAKSHTDLYS